MSMRKYGDGKRLRNMRARAEEEVKKHGVFDIKDCTFGYLKQRCSKERPCSPIVNLYAKMGIHRYNLLQGTKFQLKRVKKYIQTTGSLAASYYITLNAIDPTGGSSLQTFQTKVSEEGYGRFILTCDITRIRGETKDDDETLFFNFPMPEWPPENPFDNYYRLKESELQDNDWIRLYVELAVATAGARNAFPNLEIVKVAIRDEGLDAKNATFYISYIDLSKAALGEVSDRIAIVRRSFDEDTGCFILVGQTRLTSEIISNKRKIIGLVANEDTGCFSLKGQNQSSEIIQFSGGFGVDKPFADNKRIKLHLTGLANQICEDHEASNRNAVYFDAAGVAMEY